MLTACLDSILIKKHLCVYVFRFARYYVLSGFSHALVPASVASYASSWLGIPRVFALVLFQFPQRTSIYIVPSLFDT